MEEALARAPILIYEQDASGQVCYVYYAATSRGARNGGRESSLVTNLSRTNSVQIELRLPAPRAREIAERKGSMKGSVANRDGSSIAILQA